MIRVENRESFKYLLRRGILPSAQDTDGFNAIHFAVRGEKLDFLSYMFESDFNASEIENDLNSKLYKTTNNFSMNRSQTFWG